MRRLFPVLMLLLVFVFSCSSLNRIDSSISEETASRVKAEVSSREKTQDEKKAAKDESEVTLKTIDITGENVKDIETTAKPEAVDAEPEKTVVIDNDALEPEVLTEEQAEEEAEIKEPVEDVVQEPVETVAVEEEEPLVVAEQESESVDDSSEEVLDVPEEENVSNPASVDTNDTKEAELEPVDEKSHAEEVESVPIDEKENVSNPTKDAEPIASSVPSQTFPKPVLDNDVSPEILELLSVVIVFTVIFTISIAIRSANKMQLSRALSASLSILFTALSILISVLVSGWTVIWLLYLLLLLTYFVFRSHWRSSSYV